MSILPMKFPEQIGSTDDETLFDISQVTILKGDYRDYSDEILRLTSGTDKRYMLPAYIKDKNSTPKDMVIDIFSIAYYFGTPIGYSYRPKLLLPEASGGVFVTSDYRRKGLGGRLAKAVGFLPQRKMGYYCFVSAELLVKQLHYAAYCCTWDTAYNRRYIHSQEKRDIMLLCADLLSPVQTYDGRKVTHSREPNDDDVKIVIDILSNHGIDMEEDLYLY